MYFNVIFKIYFIINLFCLIGMLIKNEFLGDFKGLLIESKFKLVQVFILYSIIYYCYIKLLEVYSQKKINKKKINIPSFYLYTVILALINIFNFSNPLLKANADYAPTNWSFIYNLLDFKLLTYIYYIYYREYDIKKKFLFYINLFLYSFIEIKNGWSGFIFTFFLIELYFYVRKKNINILQIIFTFGVGNFMYKYYQPIKFKFRGLDYNQEFTLVESLSKLMPRLNHFINFSYFTLNYEEMTLYLNTYITRYRYFSNSLQQVIPSRLYILIFNEKKSLYNLNTLFANYIFGFFEKENGIISGFGVNLLTSFIFYFQKFDSAITYTLYIILIFFIYKIIIDLFLNQNKAFQVLLLIDLHTLWINGSIATLITKLYKYVIVIILFIIIDFIKKQFLRKRKG